MPPADTQDPFADMRPHHNHDHWVTKWIRSYMVTPEDRERKLAAVLGKMKMGADELCASPPPPPSHAAAFEQPRASRVCRAMAPANRAPAYLFGLLPG